jgi:glycosyltransferase involved in cell wall biosynthesis
MSNKINIMYIIDHFCALGGTESHLSHLVTLIDKQLFGCTIVVFDFKENSLAEKIREAGIPLIHIPVARYYAANAFKKAVALRKLIKQKEIDIVQTFHFKSDFYGAIVARLSGVKHIISSKRDMGSLKSRWHFFLNRRAIGLFNGYIVVANAVGEVVATKEKVPREKLKIIYNGVDTTKFCPPDGPRIIQSRQKLGLSSTDFVVGMVAMLRPEKNHDVLLRAFEKVSKEIREIKLLIAGTGVLLDYCKEYSRGSGISKQVIFTGYTENVARVLEVLDVACLVPGRNEGLSNSILEKMAMGLPLIVTDVGGNSEAVLDGYNGIVIPPNNSEALADAILYLYHNPGKRKEMGLKSRNRVEKMFTLEKMIKDHEDYYTKLVNGMN